MEAVTPFDANFLALDTPTTQQAIAALFILESVPDESTVWRRCHKAMEQFPRMTMRVDWQSQRVWEHDAEFDLKNHLRFSKFPDLKNLDQSIAEASKRFSERFDLGRPLWTLDVISNNCGEHCVALFKIHHAVADGLGALQFFYSLCGQEETPETARRSPATAALTTGAKSLSRWQSLQRLAIEMLTPGPPSIINGHNSAARTISLIDFPLKELRPLKRLAGGSMNNVMLALVSRSIERYALKHGKVTRDLKVLMPFNLRRSYDRHAMGNQVTGIGLKLPVSTPGVRNQLTKITERLEKIKTDGSFGAYGMMGKFTGSLPLTFRRILCDAAARQTNFICTNVPGPQQPLFFGGAKILGNYAYAALMKHHGIAFAFMTYTGHMFASMVSDPNIVPNPQELMNYFREAFEELKHEQSASRLKHDSHHESSTRDL